MRVLLILCSLAAVGWGQNGNGTVVDYLTRVRFSTLVNLIDQAGLTDTLKGAGPFTIFAPTNRALSNVDTSDKAKLAEVLKYHVVSGIYKRADLYNERVLDSLQQNAKIRFNNYLSVGVHTAEGQRIVSSDHVVGNGVVHMINGVMTPPTGTVLDIISSSPNTTNLLAAVQKAGLDSFLQDQNPITLFAPTDAAFASLGAGTVQGLLANPTLLAGILKYHAIPGSLYTAGYHAGYLHSFDEDDKLRLHKFLFFGYEVDSGTATGTQLSATNGVVHMTDRVLVPKSLSAQVSALASSATTPAPMTTVTNVMMMSDSP